MKYKYEDLKKYAVWDGMTSYYPTDLVNEAIDELVQINNTQKSVLKAIKDLFKRFTFNTTLRRIKYERGNGHTMFTGSCIPFFKRDASKILKPLEDLKEASTEHWDDPMG